MARRSRAKTAAVATAAGLIFTVAVVFGVRKLLRNDRLVTLTGAIIAHNKDPHLQRPIGSAAVTVTYGQSSFRTVSEASGLFRVRLEPPIARDEILEVRVEHGDYHPFALTASARDQIYVIRLVPKRPPDEAPAGRDTSITNVRIRYSTRATTVTTVGTAVRTFDIVNKGNTPCEGRPPCSPDGKWKASIDGLSLDAGEQSKQFRNVRVSCIAGPCPFTSIEQDRFSRGGRNITVSVRNWSDTVTYLLEAEVAMTMESELIRHTYPVTFGRSMNFTLPAVATGLTIEAEVDGSEIVYPLGPELRLSWAACRFETAAEGAKQFRCELKPGYRFN
jgi:hypothetical protein